jgi:DNA-binding CsgD family transcriptional regulator
MHVADHYASALALCDGDLTGAETAALRSYEWSRLLTGRDASGVHGIQMFGIRREQGRLGELAPVVRVLAAGDRPGAWAPGLVVVLATLGLQDEARRELRRLRSTGLSSLRESLWLAGLTYLADASSALADEESAADLYPELEPYQGSNIQVGHLVSCQGAADRYLGMLATVLGEWELAEGHFESALRLNRHLGARTWLAHTNHEYGRMLLARAKPDDRRAATGLLGDALALAREIGMAALESRIGALGTTIAGPTALPDGLSAREVEILRLVARGLSNREIGAELFISEHTAANHIRSILRKTSCTNRTEAAAYAHRRGLAVS